MTETSSEEIISALLEKCTKQSVLTAMLRQKCLSSPIQKDRFTAGIVFLTTGHLEKTDIKCYLVTIQPTQNQLIDIDFDITDKCD